jgi:sigma-B regulation protein RsbU (phosphoserine phosphatase)
MRFSIRWKLVVAVGIPLLLVYAVMLAILIGQLRERTHARLEEQVERLAITWAARIDDRFHLAARSAEAARAMLLSGDNWSEEQLYGLLERTVASDPMIHGAKLVSFPVAIQVLDVDGALVRQRLGPEDQALLAEGWTEPFADHSAGGRPTCSYVTPDGVLTADVALDAIPEQLDWLDVEGGVFGIVSGEGRHVLDPIHQFDEDRNLLSTVEARGDPEILEAARRILAGESGVIQAEGLLIPGRRWIAFAPIASTGWSFVIAAPESMVLAFSRSQASLGLGIMLAGLVVILLLLLYMASRITRPLARLATATGKLGDGDLKTRITGLDSADEIGDLSRSFNVMVEDLNSHVTRLTEETAAREALESEIRVARKIQTSLLPTGFPEDDRFELHAVNIPAKQVAGDFFDWFFHDDDTLIFLIADVSGKGVPAALFMAFARTVLRQVCAGNMPPAEAIAEANAMLERDNVGSMYTTLFIGWYEPGSGLLRYVNGGHPSGYRLKADGSFVEFGEATGAVVGLLPGRSYEEVAIQLDVGERVVLFTDGVPEAENAEGEFFGDGRVRALVDELAGESVEGLCGGISRRIDQYEAGDPHDDVTVLAFGRKA